MSLRQPTIAYAVLEEATVRVSATSMYIKERTMPPLSSPDFLPCGDTFRHSSRGAWHEKSRGLGSCKGIYSCAPNLFKTTGNCCVSTAARVKAGALGSVR